MMLLIDVVIGGSIPAAGVIPAMHHTYLGIYGIHCIVL